MRIPGSPFRLETDEALLADVRARVEAARFPAQQGGDDWQTGTPLDYMRRLRDYWLNSFDWSRWVDRINAFEQRMIDVRGERVHVIVEQGSGPDPLPLLMSHGWPGSFIEFLDIVDKLAHPERHGGRIEDACTVIVASLPGYGLSPAPSRPLAASDIASLWSSLMVEHFEVDHYVAYGSDWGSIVTANMAFTHADRLDGVMMTIAGARPDFASGPPMSAEEKEWVSALQDVQACEGAYQAIQATKPQTLAYAQTDSPIGLAAWIVEKFHAWSAAGPNDDPPFPMDVLLANVMLYWMGGSLAPSWIYMFMDEIGTMRTAKAKVPAVFMIPPDDLFPPTPRVMLERLYDVVNYKLDGIGHFPGLDSPEILVAEIRRMLLPLGRKD
ncbi:epoxide hydrolase family protein [Sphingopyxis flava]|uniref:Pimeloyl-ACP methyl ester carboxylesterase n=1 Tax=Sphingopyxis flava TaxID=1507287 RepID=A0A1T5E6X4_9SPHN|nr:epoxide hydrolase family protein [Sphingopyxis flava]SKB79550.1 Pimeloyl-ACP methyl ester carboxylesterase [Sphingopyxis flava]